MSAVCLARFTAAGALASAALVVAPATPAVAAGCPTTTGVTVVVDFTALEGGVATTCVEDGGGDTAAELFEVDHDLTRVQSFPGAVCRVDGAPSDLSCRNMPPQHYYWALYWSEDGGERVYASEGVDSLEVPDGGSVAFVFHKSDPPSENASPSPGGSGGGGDNGSTGSSDTSGSETPSPASGPSPSATAAEQPADRDDKAPEAHRSRGERDSRGLDRNRDDRDLKRDREPVAGSRGMTAPSDDPSEAVPTADPPPTDDGGLPVWVAPAGIGGLFAAAGAMAWWRRRIAV